MTAPDPGLRPYRVVFTRPGEPRRGTIVLTTAPAAHDEARAIAAAGGRAEVHYVEADGTRTTLATYPRTA